MLEYLAFEEEVYARKYLTYRVPVSHRGGPLFHFRAGLEFHSVAATNHISFLEATSWALIVTLTGANHYKEILWAPSHEGVAATPNYPIAAVVKRHASSCSPDSGISTKNFFRQNSLIAMGI